MTEIEKEQLLAELTEETSGAVIRYALKRAKEAIFNKAFPFFSSADLPPEVPEQYESKQIEIAKFLLLKQGAEGETAHSENGVSRSYEGADIPESMLRDVVPRIKTLSKNRGDNE